MILKILVYYNACYVLYMNKPTCYIVYQQPHFVLRLVGDLQDDHHLFTADIATVASVIYQLSKRQKSCNSFFVYLDGIALDALLTAKLWNA